MIAFLSRHRILVFFLSVALSAALIGIGGLAGDVRTFKMFAHLGEWIGLLAP